jgi:L-arabinonolactonase
MRYHARRLLDIENALGEGVVWCSRGQALFWTDIPAATLWRFRPEPGELRFWTMPERLCCLALCEADGWLLLGLESRLAFFHLESETLAPVAAIEPGLPTRVNDGACDRQGRFVFGTLHEPRDGEAPRAVGGFYRLNRDLTVERLPLPGVAISNSLAFTADGERIYHCDTTTGRIECSAYDSDGRLGATRIFVGSGTTPGVPDGATADSTQGLWSARWGAGRVVRYDDQGNESETVEVSASQPTRAAFGGPDLTTLYITSAYDGLSAAARDAEPNAGALFAIDNVGPGLPEARFGVSGKRIDDLMEFRLR